MLRILIFLLCEFSRATTYILRAIVRNGLHSHTQIQYVLKMFTLHKCSTLYDYIHCCRLIKICKFLKAPAPVYRTPPQESFSTMRRKTK